MRAFAILATIYAGTLGTTSALVEVGVRTTVTVDATDYDDGYVPENTRDGSRSANSRWSCQGDGCCITYSFEEAQDLVTMRIAFHKGDERTRTLDVYDNGDHHSEITSSGTTLWYETFDLNTDETEEIELCLDGDNDEWISITEGKTSTSCESNLISYKQQGPRHRLDFVAIDFGSVFNRYNERKKVKFMVN